MQAILQVLFDVWIQRTIQKDLMANKYPQYSEQNSRQLLMLTMYI